MLIVPLIPAILAAILLQALVRANDGAKFIPWLAPSRRCANYPACIVPFNFQDWEGNTLNSICEDADVENFKAYEYNGNLMKDSSHLRREELEYPK